MNNWLRNSQDKTIIEAESNEKNDDFFNNLNLIIPIKNI